MSVALDRANSTTAALPVEQNPPQADVNHDVSLFF